MSDYVKNDFFIIDSHFHAYRSFFSINKKLSTKINDKIVYTNAIFGFIKFLIYLKNRYNPKYCTFVFDRGKPKERIELLPQYKENRPPMPDELHDQLAGIKEVIKYFGCEVVEQEHCEADDIIATLTERFYRDVDISIFTNDKDLLQLLSINSKIKILVTDKNSIFRVKDSSSFIKEYEILPEQMVDLLSLTGDASDNIDGVIGVGRKTAIKLLKQYHSVENIFSNLNLISNDKFKDKIANGKDIVFRNKKIITLNKNVELDNLECNNLEFFKTKRLDFTNLYSFCNFYELNSIVKQIEKLRQFKNKLTQDFLF